MSSPATRDDVPPALPQAVQRAADQAVPPAADHAASDDERDREHVLARHACVLPHWHRLIAHDLRAPMNAMQLALELLDGAHGESATEATTRHLAILREEMARLAGLVEQRLEAGEALSARVEVFDLRELLVEVTRLMMPVLRQCGARLKSLWLREPGAAAEEALLVPGMRDRLAHALLEVLLDCRDHAGADEVITLGLEARDEAAVMVITSPSGDAVAARAALNARHQTIEAASLHAARWLMEAQGGSLTIEAVEGGGVRYALRMPVSSGVTAARKNYRTTATPAPG